MPRPTVRTDHNAPAAPPDYRQLRAWRSLPRNFARQVLLNTAIALILWGMAPRRDVDVLFVYSQAIGLSIWLLIQGGALFIDRDSPVGWPRGGKGAALAVVGIVAGCVIGVLAGDAYSGSPTWQRVAADGFSGPFVFGFTLVVGGVISYFYFINGKNAHMQAQLEATQRQASEAQLRLLQSQLEPHMLFNTLANLRALIAADPPRAQAMLDDLIAFLRATLGASRAATHSLQAEFDLLRAYLELMAVRMGPRLAYTLQLPAHLAHIAVPPLILQPLVENAIRHGLEPQVAGGHITVRAHHHNGQCILQVLDTGVGLPDHSPAGAALKAQPGRGFGLAQIGARLTTLYGAQGAIELIANKPHGTCASVHFPCTP